MPCRATILWNVHLAAAENRGGGRLVEREAYFQNMGLNAMAAAETTKGASGTQERTEMEATQQTVLNKLG